MTLPPLRITDRYAVIAVPGAFRGGRQIVELIGPVEYRVGSAESQELIVVPAGYQTDLASVPWGFRNCFPPLGRWSPAAIVHDYLYDTGGLNGRYSRSRSDEIFLEAMAVLGVPWLQRSAMFRAVRIGGASGWKPPSKAQL